MKVVNHTPHQLPAPLLHAVTVHSSHLLHLHTLLVHTYPSSQMDSMAFAAVLFLSMMTTLASRPIYGPWVSLAVGGSSLSVRPTLLQQWNQLCSRGWVGGWLYFGESLVRSGHTHTIASVYNLVYITWLATLV